MSSRPVSNNHGPLLWCPVCGTQRRKRSADPEKPDHLCCNGCYDAYVMEAGRSLAGGKSEFPNLAEWIVPRGQRLLKATLEEMKAKTENLENIKTTSRNEALERVKANLRGRTVAREIFDAALTAAKETLWQELHGNKAYAEVKTAESKCSQIEAVLRRIADNAADNGKNGRTEVIPEIVIPETKPEEKRD